MGVTDYTAEAGVTVRQRIIDALKLKATNMVQNGEPVWRAVVMGDLEDKDNQSMPLCGISFGDETMLNNTFPCSTFELPLYFNFRFRGQRGVDEHQLYMYYLGLLQYTMLNDHNLGGLTLDIEEKGNAHNIIGVEGVFPGGTLIAQAIYRTRLHNPYKLPHEA